MISFFESEDILKIHWCTSVYQYDEFMYASKLNGDPGELFEAVKGSFATSSLK